MELTKPAEQSAQQLTTGIAAPCHAIETMRIESHADAELAARRLRWASLAREEIERERDAVLEPINAAVARIRTWFSPLTLRLEACDRRLRDLLAAYDADTRANNVAALTTGAPMVPPVELSEVQMVATTEIEIVDANAVPRDLCSPDMKKIRARVADSADAIPGVRVERTTAPRLRARRAGK